MKSKIQGVLFGADLLIPESAVLALAAGWAQAQGVAYVSSEKDNALTLVDLKTQAVIGTVATCKRPRHLQRTPDGKQIEFTIAEVVTKQVRRGGMIADAIESQYGLNRATGTAR